jgi:endo-alpha-1,4-polygalactosaminidase (GH114 family)
MSQEDPFDSLYQKLQELQTWPTVYMFKFIVPADNEKLARLESLFNTSESEVVIRTSRNGNFISLTAKELMMSPEKVIEKYRKASEVEGVISL